MCILKKRILLAFVAENPSLMFILVIVYSLHYAFFQIPNNDNNNHL